MVPKKYLLLLAILPILLLSLTAISVPVKSSKPFVKVYAEPPRPFQTVGLNVRCDIYIETSGIADNSEQGIIGWAMNIQVDPESLNTSRTPVGSKLGYFLFDFANANAYADPNLLPGTLDDETGFWYDLTEMMFPIPAGGAAAPTAKKLVRLRWWSASIDKPCLIDLIDVQYFGHDGEWYDVDVVVDGWYGTPGPSYMSAIGSGPTQIDLSDPLGTQWHELYPNYSHDWTLIEWNDTGSVIGELDTSDQIGLLNATGWMHFFHVDAITITIHWTWKEYEGGPLTEFNGSAEPPEIHYLDYPMGDPIGTYWHEIYPEYSRWLNITSWEDTDGHGTFNVSDQFDFEYLDDPGTVHWAHLDYVSTDIILSKKPIDPVWRGIPEFPLGLGLMIAIAPAIPIVYLWRTRKKVLKK